MKKLRLFDSLKFVVAAIVCTLILNVAHADTTAIQSVIAYGKTEQSGTPTPTNPVPIMTNNGELKVSPNICTWNQSLTATGNGTQANLYSGLFTPSGYEFEQNTQYTISFDVVADNVTYSESGNLLYLVIEYTDGTINYPGVTSANYQNGRVVIKTAVGKTVSEIRIWNRTQRLTGGTITVSNMRIEEGSTATTGVVTNGLTETIRDAAGHKATAQMLLSVGDYKDEQNITTGAITRRVGVKVFDGSESWYLVNSAQNNVYDVMRIDLSSVAPDAKNNLSTAEQLAVKCTHLVRRGVSAFNGDVSGFDWATRWFDSTPRVAFRVAGITTVAQFKSWLAEQYANGTPVIVVYPLATETTESVAAQTLTTAPVRQTLGAIMNMPIVTTLMDGTVIGDLIRVATTKYNEESFEDVQDALTGVFNAVDTVVTQTMSQAQQIDQIATNKQTRPDEGCSAKYCLLVEDEDGTPHWYPIAGANGVEYVLPSGYTQLEYIQSDGSSWIIVPYRVNNKTVFYARYNEIQKGRNSASAVFGVTSTPDTSKANYGILRLLNGTSNFNRMGWGDSTSGSVIDVNAPQNLNTWYEVLYDQNKLYQDNVLYATSATPNDTEWVANYDLGIFARNGADVTMPAIAKISSVWAKEDGEYKINLIPARRDSDMALGMYDMVSGTFFTNAGTGTFTAGPDM